MAAEFTVVESGEVGKPDARCGAGGIGVPTPDSQAVAVPGAENRLLAQMIAQRLLVTDPSQGKEAAPICARKAKVALVEPELHVVSRPREGISGG